jgi:hypothetical protein
MADDTQLMKISAVKKGLLALMVYLHRSCRFSSWLGFVAATVQVGGSVSAAVGVLVGPVTNPSNGHDYYLLTAGSWQDSEAQARQMGGHLATVRNEAENHWVVSTFGTYDSTARDLWIGLTNGANGWVYVNGEPVTFTNWADGEPNNVGGVESFGGIYGASQGFNGRGEWNDWDNVAGNSVSGLVEVAALPPVIAGPILNPANTHVYYLLADSSWTAAEARAVKLGGHLATVNDAAENAWIDRTFGSYGGQTNELWIGLSDSGHVGHFTWADGTPVGFLNWHAGEPNFIGSEHYGLILRLWDGQWNNLADYWPTESYPTRGVVEVPLTSPLPELSANHAIEVGWQSEAGKSYQLQSRLGTEATWTNDGEPVAGTGHQMSLFERATSPTKFYRIVPLN